MKIALCTEILYPLYGVEKRVYAMAVHLGRLGLDVDVFTSTPQRFFPEINIVQTSNPTITNPPKRNYAFCLEYWTNLARKLSRNSYDIIDANGHLALLPCSFAGVLRKKPVVATIHDLYLGEWSSMYSGKASPFGLLMEVLSAKLPYEKIITLNTSLKRAMTEKLGINKKKIEIIPSGIDVKYIKSVRAGKKKNRAIYVGRLAPQKNVLLMLKAFAGVDSFMKLDIVGEGVWMEYLKQQAELLNIGDRVVFHGKIENHETVIKMIKESSVFVLPSLRESFGITILEAMCCGTAVVSTNTEGPRDSIISGFNGFLCDFNENDMAEKINIVVEDPALRKKMEKNGLKTAVDYDWEKIVDKIASCYNEVLDK